MTFHLYVFFHVLSSCCLFWIFYYMRPIVRLWHNHTSCSKYAIPQGEVNSDWLIHTSWGIFYTSWGINRPIRVYLKLRYGIFASWGMYLTSTVGRGGIKFFTPREGIKISSPRAEGARGRIFSTLPRGKVFYTFPPNWWGKAFLHSSKTC